MALINLQGKVLPEVLEKFKAAQENSECETFNQFVEILLESFLNPKTRTVEIPTPTAAQLQEIQLKENEIGRIKIEFDFRDQHIEELTAENSTLRQQLSESATRNPEPVTPNPDQFLLTIPPIMSAVLDIEQEVAKKKSGKDFSIGDLLLNNFWESIVNGASYPFRIWSKAELTRLAKNIQAIEQQ
jgi:hypothetical protein